MIVGRSKQPCELSNQELLNQYNRGQLDLNSPANKYCISWCTTHVANVGLKILVESWNNHPLPSIV